MTFYLQIEPCFDLNRKQFFPRQKHFSFTLFLLEEYPEKNLNRWGFLKATQTRFKVDIFCRFLTLLLISKYDASLGDKKKKHISNLSMKCRRYRLSHSHNLKLKECLELSNEN